MSVSGRLRRIEAGAVCDGTGPVFRPGAVVVASDAEGGAEVMAWGEPGELARRFGGGLPVTRCPGRLLVPGGVNAHVHLDLHAIGPVDYPGDFISWGMAVRDRWAQRTVAATAAGAAAAV